MSIKKSTATSKKNVVIQSQNDQTLTVEGTTSAVLTAIRQHSSLAEQNKIVKIVVHEIGMSRLNLIRALESDLNFARQDGEEFFGIQPRELIEKANSAR